MDVHAGHVGAGLERAPRGLHAAFLGLGQEVADGMEQEGAGPAGGVEHFLLQGPLHGVADDLRGQPVGRVVFAEAVPLVAVDQRFVEDLQDVAVDLREAETAHMRHDAAYEPTPGLVDHDPVEEVALDRAEDAGGAKGLARQELAGVVFLQAEHGDRHAFCDDHQERVLKPQRVAIGLASVDELEELRPKLALQRDSAIRLEPVPRRRERHAGTAERDRILPEFDADGQRVGWQRRLERHDAVEPGQERPRLLGIEHRVLELDEGAADEFERGPSTSVRRDADESFALLAFAIGEVVRHAPHDIGPLLGEVALGFEDRSADQRVDAAAHLRDAPLEVE